MQKVKEKHIVVGVTASIAIYKACDIVRRLREKNLRVSVIMTKEAQELIRPIVFQSLSGTKVYTDMFQAPAEWEIEHISLAESADQVLVAPATVNIIGKIACGISDDLLTCVISATRAKVLIAPAMNENMYLNKITQENIKKLKALGYKFVGPRQGRLVCGKLGVGCLEEVDTIVNEAIKAL